MSIRLVDDQQRRECAASSTFSRVALAIALPATSALILTTLPLLYVAENRLVRGMPLDASTALGPWLWPVVALAAAGCAFLFDETKRPIAALLIVATLLLVAVVLGNAAASLAATLPRAGRVRLGSGSLLLAASFVATMVFALRRTPRRTTRGIVFGLAVATLAVARSGAFDALSIVIEYHGRSQALREALLEHVLLVSGALVLAIVTVAVLYPWRATRSAFEQIAAGLQVVPAVALLGALVAALSALLAIAPALRDFGIAALGFVPALCGIAAYLLLPLWRGLRAGLSAADPASIEAGEALGMTRGQILARIRLPQGAPALLGALRIATVQSIGLATLGALVGAGGFGRIVFDGMAQYAPDLILLGALPITLLAWLADSALSACEGRLRR